ncbi:hypothetical protein [Terricaulis sp.]|uniref:hypothetical protein n=1 Tax=Terricaulis sp. TaxID=2768686 RepID=UPI002AC6104D|nr:hypothetical protein [Terricaulis sp.]MDZ4689770.1 hypothetical protein [Terricaulis sp.]
MFSYTIDLSGVKAWFDGAADAGFNALAGFAFMVLAMAAIQYDEQIAPEVSRISDGWSTATMDFRSKLSSFTL